MRYGSWSESKNELKANTNASHRKHDSFAQLISLIDSDHGSGSQPESEINLEVEISVQSLDSSGRSRPHQTPSGDFFQVIPHILPKSYPSNGIPKPNGGIKQLNKNEKVDVSSEALYRLEESIVDSPESTPRFSDITHEFLFPQMSPTQSPFIQVMETPGNFDPGRIPASIFSKPLSTMEWSVASSLFSVHIGNCSFRSHASKRVKGLYRSGELLKSEEPFNFNQIYQSGEFYKSEELYQSEEPFKSGDPKKTCELSGSELNSSASKEVEPDENIGMAKNLSQNRKPRAKGAIDAAASAVSMAHINQGGINLGEPKDSVSANRLTDRSEAIVQSVSFAKQKKSAYSLCHCSHCRRLFCSCKWPTLAAKALSTAILSLPRSTIGQGEEHCRLKQMGYLNGVNISLSRAEIVCYKYMNLYMHILGSFNHRKRPINL